MSTIVIGVDGTPAATRATEVGVALAAGLGAQVVFIHFSPLAEELFERSPQTGPPRRGSSEPTPSSGRRRRWPRSGEVPAELRIQDERRTGMIAANLGRVGRRR